MVVTTRPQQIPASRLPVLFKTSLDASILAAIVHALREAAGSHGLTCLGDPSAVVPVLIGHTPLARVASREVLRRGLFANLVEFPAVAKGQARFRLQVMAGHGADEVEAAAERMAWGMAIAKGHLDRAAGPSPLPMAG